MSDWMYNNYCKRCNKVFRTNSKYGRICDNCRKKTGGYYPKASHCNSYWDKFLLDNKISSNDLKDYRGELGVKKKSGSVRIIHGC